MSNIKLERDHTGELHLKVGEQFAMGARVTSMIQVNDELTAVVFIPLKHAVMGEASNVVPFVRPATDG